METRNRTPRNLREAQCGAAAGQETPALIRLSPPAGCLAQHANHNHQREPLQNRFRRLQVHSKGVNRRDIGSRTSIASLP